MQFKFAAAAGFLALATLTAPAVSSAAALPGSLQPAATAAAGQMSMAEHVDWPRWGWGRCRGWRRECAARWGWGGPGFRRCLWRHGC